MKKIKSINKKAVEMNLAFSLKDALVNNDIPRLHKAAQDVIDAGYELEDLKLLPSMFTLICNALIASGFSPKYDDIPGVIVLTGQADD